MGRNPGEWLSNRCPGQGRSVSDNNQISLPPIVECAIAELNKRCVLPRPQVSIEWWLSLQRDNYYLSSYAIRLL